MKMKTFISVTLLVFLAIGMTLTIRRRYVGNRAHIQTMGKSISCTSSGVNIPVNYVPEDYPHLPVTVDAPAHSQNIALHGYARMTKSGGWQECVIPNGYCGNGQNRAGYIGSIIQSVEPAGDPSTIYSVDMHAWSTSIPPDARLDIDYQTSDPICKSESSSFALPRKVLELYLRYPANRTPLKISGYGRERVGDEYKWILCDDSAGVHDNCRTPNHPIGGLNLTWQDLGLDADNTNRVVKWNCANGSDTLIRGCRIILEYSPE
jgi:hypothetical protein